MMSGTNNIFLKITPNKYDNNVYPIKEIVISLPNFSLKKYTYIAQFNNDHNKNNNEEIVIIIQLYHILIYS